MNLGTDLGTRRVYLVNINIDEKSHRKPFRGTVSYHVRRAPGSAPGAFLHDVKAPYAYHDTYPLEKRGHIGYRSTSTNSMLKC